MSEKPDDYVIDIGLGRRYNDKIDYRDKSIPERTE
jgi:hypothetical protein